MNDTRQMIIDVAVRHFANMEYSSVNLEAIAQEVHVTRAPLYYYFKNKEGLYRAVVEHTLAECREHMNALLNADEDILEIVRKEYAYCLHGTGVYRRIWYPEPGAPDCGDQVRAFSQWLLNLKTSILQAAKARGELKEDCDVSELVTLIYTFFSGVMDVRRTSANLTGFNRQLLENSEEWFMEIFRSRCGR